MGREHTALRNAVKFPGRAGRRPGRNMRRYRLGTFVTVAVALLTGCGTAAGGAASGAAKQSGPGTASTVISAHQLPGVGTVLVDSSGKTIYTPDQESGGKILCTGSCLGFWFPVTAPSGSPAVPGALAGAVGTVHRPDDGKTQLTYNGKPLYTFRLDQAAGQAHGNNFTDRFGSMSFTWRAVTTSGTGTGPGSAGGSQGSPAATPGGGPGYGGNSGYGGGPGY